MLTYMITICKRENLSKLQNWQLTAPALCRDCPEWESPAGGTENLEANGFTVGIIAQPNWRDPESVCTLGEPKLGFLVSAGNMDSMVNHYSVAKKRRRSDFFSPGGKMGLRPDYAVIVYSNLIRRTFKKTPTPIACRKLVRPKTDPAMRPPTGPRASADTATGITLNVMASGPMFR